MVIYIQIIALKLPWGKKGIFFLYQNLKFAAVWEKLLNMLYDCESVSPKRKGGQDVVRTHTHHMLCCSVDGLIEFFRCVDICSAET